jgi:putative Holliday junction resolvase
MDGSRSPLCDRVEKFARRLEGRYQLRCYGIDERLSSIAAEELQGNDRKSISLDSLAAQIILESWFDEFKRSRAS